MRKLDFDQTLLEAVDHALLSFGESPRKAIYFHLDKSFKLQKKDIPEDAGEFSHALNTIFGPGAQTIQKLILRNLYSKLNLEFEENCRLEFVDYISQARENARHERRRLTDSKTKRRRRSPIELK